MKNRRLFYYTMLATLVAGLAAATTASAEGDAKAGRVKAFGCLGCHGIPGYSSVYPTYHVPRVGGQHADYIIAALRAYKAKERSHPSMQAQAATLSDEDMRDIAAFFSSKPK